MTRRLWRFCRRRDLGRYPATIEEVSLPEALINYEDRWFWRHSALTFPRRCAQDLTAGRVISGGSTLTMQVATAGLRTCARSAVKSASFALPAEMAFIQARYPDAVPEPRRLEYRYRVLRWPISASRLRVSELRWTRRCWPYKPQAPSWRYAPTAGLREPKRVSK